PSRQPVWESRRWSSRNELSFEVLRDSFTHWNRANGNSASLMGTSPSPHAMSARWESKCAKVGRAKVEVKAGLRWEAEKRKKSGPDNEAPMSTARLAVMAVFVAQFPCEKRWKESFPPLCWRFSPPRRAPRP